MKVSVIGGTGPQGLGIAERLAIAGVDVIVGSRKEEKAFVYGDFRPILVDDKEIVAYYRVYGKDKFLVICNFYGRDRIIEIADFDGTNVKVTEIISNYCDSSTELGKLKLRPYESVIYKIDSIVQ